MFRQPLNEAVPLTMSSVAKSLRIPTPETWPDRFDLSRRSVQIDEHWFLMRKLPPPDNGAMSVGQLIVNATGS
jgi:hypothetical protein